MPDSVRQEKGDLISRNDAIEVINKLMEIHFDRKVVLGKVWQQIKDLPSAQKKVHWRNYEGTLTCSVCEAEFDNGIMEYCGDDVPMFCPDCGADMRGDEDG